MNSPPYHFQQQSQPGNSSGQSPSQQPSTPVTPVPGQQFPSMPQSAFTGQGFQQFPVQSFTPQQQQQFAAWAYQAQQMMFQQQQMGFQQPGTLPPPAAYLTPQQQQALQMQFLQQQQLMNQLPPQPPYARDNNGSRTSLGSSNEGSRQRTTSNKSSAGGHRANGGSASSSPTQTHPPHSFPSQRPRVSSTSSSQKAGSLRSATPPVSASRSATPPVSAPQNGAAKVNKPSPLSQGSYAQVAAGKGSTKPAASPPAKGPSRVPQDPAPTPAMLKSGGLKGRLTRALSRSGMERSEEDNGDSSRRKPGAQRQPIPPRASADSPSSPRSPSHAQTPSTSTTSSIPPPIAYAPTEGSIHSTETETAATKPKKKSLFNSRFNRSTDNMSLSSTVSSASVMIRKLGSVGKLVRRNSLAGISSVFGGKKNKEEDESKKEEKDKKNKKSKAKETAPAPALSPPEPLTDDMVGLSPAAKLARQHTLRSRAAETARVKERERIAEENSRADKPPTWEKSTTNRKKDPAMTWSDDDDESEEDGTFDGHGYQPSQPPQVSDWAGLDDSGEDDDEEYGFAAPGEDDTVRVSDRRDDFEEEPWAVGLRRSVERTRVPVKGILKHAQTYDQQTFMDGPPQAPFTRARSNSNDSAPPMGAEPGPLARIPSPDPDHIDGLHRSNSNSDHHSHHSRKLSSSSANSDLLPPINFDSSEDALNGLAGTLKDRPFSTIAPKDRPLSGSSGTFYSNGDFNASAPALATSPSDSRQAKANGPPLGLRSATVPLTQSRKLTFAANLSVYHTFSPAAYDRRSEPATCNRLTPALAQRIKEELNSYKMEEMEVHQASRMHTHFFV